MRTLSTPTSRRRLVAEQAAPYGGVLSRLLLRDLGVDHRAVAREVVSDRWGAPRPADRGHPPRDPARRGEVVAGGLGGRSGHPALDGVTGLQAYGLTGYDESRLHVSVTHGWRPLPVDGVRLHHVSRLEGEVRPLRSMPCTRPEIAAVRAAHWAVSDRQAALVRAMAVQQGLVGVNGSPGRLVRSGRGSGGPSCPSLCRTSSMVPGRWASSTSRPSAGSSACPNRTGRMRRGPRGCIYLDVRWSAKAGRGDRRLAASHGARRHR